MDYLIKIVDWSEVWGVLIPVIVFLRYPHQPRFLRPIIIYCLIALPLNVFIDSIWYFSNYLPCNLQSNNFLYNVQSIIRLICLGIFFSVLKESFFIRSRHAVLIISLSLIVMNFVLVENFMYSESFSSRLLAFESGLILFYCLQYFIYRLVKNDTLLNNRREFWVILGLSIYVIFNFPYFLFYTTFIRTNRGFAEAMWNFHNLTYVICCLFFARAFYAPSYK